MRDLTKLNEAEAAVREIREVGIELRRVTREGLPYNGPKIEWQSGNLGATWPEPHIALDRQGENFVDVDENYLLRLRLAVAMEAGYRERAVDEQIERLR